MISYDEFISDIDFTEADAPARIERILKKVFENQNSGFQIYDYKDFFGNFMAHLVRKQQNVVWIMTQNLTNVEEATFWSGTQKKLQVLGHTTKEVVKTRLKSAQEIVTYTDVAVPAFYFIHINQKTSSFRQTILDHHKPWYPHHRLIFMETVK